MLVLTPTAREHIQVETALGPVIVTRDPAGRDCARVTIPTADGPVVLVTKPYRGRQVRVGVAGAGAGRVTREPVGAGK